MPVMAFTTMSEEAFNGTNFFCGTAVAWTTREYVMTRPLTILSTMAVRSTRGLILDNDFRHSQVHGKGSGSSNEQNNESPNLTDLGKVQDDQQGGGSEHPYHQDCAPDGGMHFFQKCRNVLIILARWSHNDKIDTSDDNNKRSNSHVLIKRFETQQVAKDDHIREQLSTQEHRPD